MLNEEGRLVSEVGANRQTYLNVLTENLQHELSLLILNFELGGFKSVGMLRELSALIGLCWMIL